jgi:sugar lactone lactonase YvrE
VIVDVDVALDARAVLGEGPVWDQREEVLRWVDILPGLVHRFDPATGEDTAFEFGEQVGTVAARARGGLLLATETGLWTCADNGAIHQRLYEVDTDPPGGRFNDGKVDPWGRFWAGTMREDREGAAALYRLDPDGSLHRMLTGVSISNGIDWSPDGRTLYYVDTPTGGLDAFDHDPDSGTLTNRRRLADVDRGSPDGLTVDADGCVWVALWDGWGVRRYAPDGRLLSTVEVPAQRVTSCAFGGPDLSTLYITSATIELSDLDGQPHAGALFACAPGVSGLQPGEWAG